MSKFKVQINGGEIVEVESVCVIYEVDGVDLLDDEESEQKLSMKYTPGGCVSELLYVKSDMISWHERAFLHNLIAGSHSDGSKEKR